MTLQLLWEEYAQGNELAYKYTSFCVKYRASQNARSSASVLNLGSTFSLFAYRNVSGWARHLYCVTIRRDDGACFPIAWRRGASSGRTPIVAPSRSRQRSCRCCLRASTGECPRAPGSHSGPRRQYLKAGLVDELHLVITNALLGSGESLFDGMDNVAQEYEWFETVGSETVTHVRLVKKSRN